jgi:hypothetical protein
MYYSQELLQIMHEERIREAQRMSQPIPMIGIPRFLHRIWNRLHHSFQMKITANQSTTEDLSPLTTQEVAVVANR